MGLAGKAVRLFGEVGQQSGIVADEGDLVDAVVEVGEVVTHDRCLVRGETFAGDMRARIGTGIPAVIGEHPAVDRGTLGQRKDPLDYSTLYQMMPCHSAVAREHDTAVERAHRHVDCEQVPDRHHAGTRPRRHDGEADPRIAQPRDRRLIAGRDLLFTIDQRPVDVGHDKLDHCAILTARRSLRDGHWGISTCPPKPKRIADSNLSPKVCSTRLR